MSFKAIRTCFGVLFLAGCAVPPKEVDLASSFSAEEHRHYMVPGHNIIDGQAFLRQKGGGVVTCAGSDVVAFPDTSYFMKAFYEHRLGNKVKVSTAPEARAVVHKTTCDAEGKFSFNDLPDGPWTIATEVMWVVGYHRQGGTLYTRVSVYGAEIKNIVLSDINRI